MDHNFFNQCKNIILLPNPKQKCLATEELYQSWQNKRLFDFEKHQTIDSIPNPGAPKSLQLVSPLQVSKRRLGTKSGHASLIHALVHIEFNAISLALDACYRFQDMPIEYYQDWLSVAKDEAYHFQLLHQHLADLGYFYGSFSAHNGLWDMALRTESDVLLRMALVPRVLEARGLDAVPEMQKKMQNLGDQQGSEILSIIYHDEIRHVQYGDKWFKYMCNSRNLDPDKTFLELINEFNAPKIRGTFNRESRKLAGFSDFELNQIYAISKE